VKTVCDVLQSSVEGVRGIVTFTMATGTELNSTVGALQGRNRTVAGAYLLAVAVSQFVSSDDRNEFIMVGVTH
jgi:hypothetical protein